MNNNYGNNPRPRQNVPQNRGRRRNSSRFPLTELFIGILAITAVFVLIWAFASKGGFSGFGGGNGKETERETLNYEGLGGPVTDGSNGGEGTQTEPDEKFDPNEYTEITLLNMGDIMYHSPQLEAAYVAATDSYDFSGSYKYLKNVVSAADYAVINFEATLSGDEYYAYAGYPTFNAPDTAFTPLLDTGFDMMLFANNHCYDYGHHGLIRTQEVFKEHGVDYIGARLKPEDKTYKLVNIDGINVGMINTTDDLSYGNLEQRTVNGIAIQGDDIELMDLLNHSLLDEFYAQTETRIKELKDAGADLIVYYIHWGYEYHLTHNDMQDQIASKLCDLGVDVIIGGHPHVVQDAEVLTSTVDPEHKTLCFYSLGNVVSNQNRLTMGDTMNKEYTESGLIVELTIRKYADGRCFVSAVDTMPTWVHRYYDAGTATMKYEVLPVEEALAAPEAYGLYNSSFGVTNATAALEMTGALVDGIVEAFAETVVLPTSENVSE